MMGVWESHSLDGCWPCYALYSCDYVIFLSLSYFICKQEYLNYPVLKVVDLNRVLFKMSAQ